MLPVNTDLQQADALYQEAKSLESKGKYTQAIPLCEEAVAIYSVHERWEAWVKTRSFISFCLLHIEKNAEALQYTQITLEKARLHFEEQHAAISECYSVLGFFYNSTGQFNTALEYHHKALQIQLVVYGQQHFCTAGSYGNIGLCHQNKQEYDIAIEQNLQAIRILEADDTEYPAHLGNIYSNTGNCYQYKGNISSALEYYQKALDIRQRAFGEWHQYTAHSYNCIGLYYSDKGNYNLALQYFGQALRILLEVFGLQHSDTAHCYENIGTCHSYKGDYDNALLYLQRALTLRIEMLGEHHPLTVGNYGNIGICYQLKGNHDRALRYLQEFARIYTELQLEQPFSLSLCYLNMAICYQKKENYEQAIVNAQQALSIVTQYFTPQHQNAAGIYLNIGISYLAKGETDTALAYFQDSLAIVQEIHGHRHPNTALVHKNISSCYRKSGNLVLALQSCHTALFDQLSTPPRPDDYYGLPVLEGYDNPIYLLETLAEKAAVFDSLYLQTSSAQNLLAALAHYQCADDLINQMRQSYKAEGSKLVLAENAKKIYDAALTAAHTAHRQQAANQLDLTSEGAKSGYKLPAQAAGLAFRFSEKSKAVSLLGNVKEFQARINGGIPQSLLEEEYDLRIEITFLEKCLTEAQYQSKGKQNEEQISQWQNQLFDYRQQYQNLVAAFEKDYPDYYLLKYQTEPVAVTTLQAALSNYANTALLKYFVGRDSIFLFVMTATRFEFLQLEKPADFAGLVEDFMDALKAKFKPDFITYSHALYQILVQPAIEILQPQPDSRLIIIPDDVLCQIPFEALLTGPCNDNPAYSDLPYLINQYEILYHFSATLFEYGLKKAAQTANLPNSFAGFAPVYANRTENENLSSSLSKDLADISLEAEQVTRRSTPISDFDPETLRSININGKEYAELKFSELEVSQIAGSFTQKGVPAYAALHANASLEQFRQKSGKYKYLLVSAHGDYNDMKPELSGIIFSPNQDETSPHILYQTDAYNLTLQADLVVLSCCDSGVGQLATGEGILAFNRGFLFSGASNVVYTLFKVYDQAAFELTGHLFKEILDGNSYSAALRAAKLHCIKQAGFIPVHWAGYVLIGY